MNPRGSVKKNTAHASTAHSDSSAEEISQASIYTTDSTSTEFEQQIDELFQSAPRELSLSPTYQTNPAPTKERMTRKSIDAMMRAYSANATMATQQPTTAEGIKDLEQTKNFVSSNTFVQTATRKALSNAPTDPEQLNKIILTIPRLNVGDFKKSNNSSDFFKKIKKLELVIKAITSEEMATYKFSVEELILNLSLATPIIYSNNTSPEKQRLIAEMTLLRKNILNCLSSEKLNLLQSSLNNKTPIINEYWNIKREKRGRIDQKLISDKIASLISIIDDVIKEKTLTENAISTQTIFLPALDNFIKHIENRDATQLMGLFKTDAQWNEILRELAQLPAGLNNQTYSITDIVIHLMILRHSQTIFIDNIVKQILNQLDDGNFNIVVNETIQQLTNANILIQFINNSSIKPIDRLIIRNLDLKKRTQIFSEIIRQAKAEKEKSVIHAAPAYIIEPSNNPIIDTSFSQSDPVLDALAEFTAPSQLWQTEIAPSSAPEEISQASIYPNPEPTKGRMTRKSLDEMMRAYSARENTIPKKMTAAELLEHLGPTKDFVSPQAFVETETYQKPSFNNPEELNTIILTEPHLSIGDFKKANRIVFFKEIKKLKLCIKATTAEEMATYKFSVEELILNLSLATPATPIIYLNDFSENQKDLTPSMTLLRNNILNHLSLKKLDLLKSSLNKKKRLMNEYWNIKRGERAQIDQYVINEKVSSLISMIEDVIKEKIITETSNSTKTSALPTIDKLIKYIENREECELRRFLTNSKHRNSILREIMQLPVSLNNQKCSIAEIVIHLMILHRAAAKFIGDMLKQILKKLDDENFNIVVNETIQQFTNKDILAQFVNNSSIKPVTEIRTSSLNLKQRTEIFSEIIRQVKNEKENSVIHAAHAHITEPSNNPVIDTSLSQSDTVMDALAEFTAPPPTPTHRAPLTSVRTRRAPSSTTFMMQELSTDVAPMPYASPRLEVEATENPMQESIQMLAPFSPWCMPSIYSQENPGMYGFFGPNTPPQSTSSQPSDQSQPRWLPNA